MNEEYSYVVKQFCYYPLIPHCILLLSSFQDSSRTSVQLHICKFLCQPYQNMQEVTHSLESVQVLGLLQ